MADDIVLSEVHMEPKSLHIDNKYFITRFKFRSQFHAKRQESTNVQFKPKDANKLNFDSDGDLEVQRESKKIKEEENEITLTLKHSLATPLSDVGQQLWLGAMLLADFILSNEDFSDVYAVELGAGIGFCSLVLATKSKHVFCTDTGPDILLLCKENVDNNLFNVYDEQRSIVSVRDLNWVNCKTQIHVFDTKVVEDKENEGVEQHRQFTWTKEDIDLLKKTNVIVVADCIYDEKLTEHLFHTFVDIISCSDEDVVTCFLSVEKRLNFTLTDLDVSAPSYNDFRTKLDDMQQGKLFKSMNGSFNVVRIPTTFPKWLQYERTNYLELWRVTYTKRKI